MKKYINFSGCIGFVKTGDVDGEHTFLSEMPPRYCWIKTSDLYDTYEEALKSGKPACFLDRDGKDYQVHINLGARPNKI